MDATWIVSANAGRARFFAQTGATDPLQEVNDLINSGARLRTAETESDALGQMSAPKSHLGSAGQPNGYEPQQSPAEHQTEIFARSVVAMLLKAHQEGRYKKLCLVASPEFLGVLRKLLDPNLQPLIAAEINKDYTQLNPNELRDKVRDYCYGH
jgi:protein required for attachment to host cells